MVEYKTFLHLWHAQPRSNPALIDPSFSNPSSGSGGPGPNPEGTPGGKPGGRGNGNEKAPPKASNPAKIPKVKIAAQEAKGVFWFQHYIFGDACLLSLS